MNIYLELRCQNPRAFAQRLDLLLMIVREVGSAVENVQKCAWWLAVDSVTAAPKCL